MTDPIMARRTQYQRQTFGLLQVVAQVVIYQMKLPDRMEYKFTISQQPSCLSSNITSPLWHDRSDNGKQDAVSTTNIWITSSGYIPDEITTQTEWNTSLQYRNNPVA
ncbi:hypothetical protein AVEN_59517-1 [Araneus ventricosus]|uniref:Uncharacterized protein n=1 Tax=Araneus ventricosus TaxID=182803 RepID=A0A4Y2TXT2_ARAVE|nr:hypothetical protein AVEN_59517-1 [Araneus ventricosus]